MSFATKSWITRSSTFGAKSTRMAAKISGRSENADCTAPPFRLSVFTDSAIWMSKRIDSIIATWTDAERLDLAVRGIVDKQLMFDQLTGKSARKSERCRTVNRHRGKGQS